ncbi:MAG: sulfide/dihydroorotate dehydrogenase-like FAD/NAD-binding protein [Acidimicrobiia bacterium]|nr:sulfide/dihydroorotate dehydrogenase-like FAD/NAD-binding protein [Acidimicrobiia bacterium]
MYRIVQATDVGPGVRRFSVEAPHVARHYRAGQFVIVRVDPTGERIPLTVAAADTDTGLIALYVQGIGKTTRRLNMLESGDSLHDVAGPLGKPSEIEHYGTAVVVGGGVGTAIAYPVVKALVDAGNRVISIIGGRSRDFVILESELEATGAEVIVCTDDGSYGRPGFVTDTLADTLAGTPVDIVFAAGPVPMMKAVAAVTKPDGVRTIASLNPIMVDGTGMCGGCRVDVGGKTQFACVDGPEFDAHLVDFDLLARRNQAYHDFEQVRNAELEDPSCRVESSP